MNTKQRKSVSRRAEEDVISEVFRSLMAFALFAPLLIIAAWHPVLIPVVALVGVFMFLINHAA